MNSLPADILRQFPVRKTREQKQQFRNAVTAYAETLGYDVTVESGAFGSRNVVIGDPKRAGYLITAHYDTCARLPVPNFITPCNAFVFLLTQFVLWLSIILIGMIIGFVAGEVMGELWGTLTSAFVFLLLVVLMLVGPANPSNENDNGSGVLTLLEIASTLPEYLRSKVCLVLFDLEEVGLVGSSSYRKTHKEATDRQLVLNLDCVGDGDHIMMFPTKKLLKDKRKLTSLYRACGYFGKKSVLIKEKGFYIYPSDQLSFPYGVGICALRKGKCGLYVSRIHTPRDTVLDYTNVNILRAALISFIGCSAVN